jgi:hypothetical protein
MPGGASGLDLARVVGDCYPHVRIVLATGYSEQVHDDVPFPILHKPYAIADVVALLLADNGTSNA